MQFTTNEIIKARQQAIFNRTQAIRERQYTIQLEAQELEREHHMLLAEHDILERVDIRGLILDTNKREAKPDKMHIEDAVRMIFEEAGRPIRFGELREELAKYGYVWNNYGAAYARIKSLPYIEIPSRGYMQFIRGGM